jgi:hypothetical protein
MPEGLAVGLMAKGGPVNRQPYNPATSGPQVHDRRAREISRGSASHVVEVEVDDPYEPGGARIGVLRSVRDDPLADHRARGHIDEAQYLAGREFQKHFGIAERGPRAMQMAELVDGSPARESLTDEQLRAGKWLTKCYVELGRDGAALVHDMLISNLTTSQIAASRGMIGSNWERYFARRLFEALNTLAVVFGFSNSATP